MNGLNSSSSPSHAGATSVIVSAGGQNLQQQNQQQQNAPHTTYSINGILGIDGQANVTSNNVNNVSSGQRKQRSSSKGLDSKIGAHHDLGGEQGHVASSPHNGNSEAIATAESLSLSNGPDGHHKRRPSLNPASTGNYNGLTNDNLYLAWSANPYESADPHHPSHHYESTSLYTPPALGKCLFFSSSSSSSHFLHDRLLVTVSTGK